MRYTQKATNAQFTGDCGELAQVLVEETVGQARQTFCTSGWALGTMEETQKIVALLQEGIGVVVSPTPKQNPVMTMSAGFLLAASRTWRRSFIGIGGTYDASPSCVEKK